MASDSSTPHQLRVPEMAAMAPRLGEVNGMKEHHTAREVSGLSMAKLARYTQAMRMKVMMAM